MRMPARSAAVILALVAASCGGGTVPAPEQTSTAAAPSGAPVSLDKSTYPAFPDPDAGADPAIPAEQGGRGFTGEGWTTNTDYDLIGDPRAVKGGVLRQAMMTDFPSTLRYYGPNVSAWNQMLCG